MGKALHEQAAEYIRARILSGEYAVGSQIPTENELCALLGVSRPTYTYYETGHTTPSIEDLYLLSQLYGRAMEDFLQ